MKYKGVGAYRSYDGTILDVQIEDSFGFRFSIPVAEYRQRGIQPSAENLADSSRTDLRAFMKMSRMNNANGSL